MTLRSGLQGWVRPWPRAVKVERVSVSPVGLPQRFGLMRLGWGQALPLNSSTGGTEPEHGETRCQDAVTAPPSRLPASSPASVEPLHWVLLICFRVHLSNLHRAHFNSPETPYRS